MNERINARGGPIALRSAKETTSAVRSSALLRRSRVARMLTAISTGIQTGA
jgi:hypothetical protein